MSDLYRRVNAGRLTFKGGDLAAVKSIDKKKKKKKTYKHQEEEESKGDGGGESMPGEAVDDGSGGGEDQPGGSTGAGAGAGARAGGGEQVYTIDAAKKMKYDELFPVEARKFGYDPANKARSAGKSVEEALDDRVKKKADRYCK